MFYQLLPAFVIEGYLILTLLLFNFGPIEWPVENWIITNLYLMLLFYLWGLGYSIGSKKCLGKRPPDIRARFYIVLGVFISIVTLPLSIYGFTGETLTSIDLTLEGQGDVYRNLQLEYASNNDMSRFVYTLPRTYLSPFIYSSLIFGMFYWQQYGKRLRAVIVTAIICQIIFSLSRGVDKPLVDLIVIVCCSIAATTITNKKKNRSAIGFRKRIVLFLLVFIILITFLNVFLERREGRYLGDMPNCLSIANICVDTDSSMLSGIVGEGKYLGIVNMNNYLVQGYYGLSLALPLEHNFTYGIGHAHILMVMYEKLTGDAELYKQSFNYRLGQFGWDDQYAWSSLYTWLANDVSFLGVPFVMLIIGYMMAVLWKKTIVQRDPIAFLLFVFLCILMMYSTANNQLGFGLEIYLAFVFWVGYILLRRPVYVFVKSIKK